MTVRPTRIVAALFAGFGLIGGTLRRRTTAAAHA